MGGEIEIKENVTDPSILAERSDLDGVDTPSLNLKPSFNLAAYVNKSDTLQQLVKLGVDLHRLEKKPDLAQFVLGLDFQHQIQPYLLFLCDRGIVPEELGKYLTKNPAILKEDLDDLQVRISYLQSKKFKANEIQRIVQKNPFWLMFSTPKIDDRLGFFQRQFRLTGSETRQLAVAQPRIITYSIEHIQKAAFTVVEEMGMTKAETKELVLKLPKILTMGKMGLSLRYLRFNFSLSASRPGQNCRQVRLSAQQNEDFPSPVDRRTARVPLPATQTRTETQVPLPLGQGTVRSNAAPVHRIDRTGLWHR